MYDLLFEGTLLKAQYNLFSLVSEKFYQVGNIWSQIYVKKQLIVLYYVLFRSLLKCTNVTLILANFYCKQSAFINISLLSK